MDEKVLKEYLKKLENYENVLNGVEDGEVDEDFMKEIEKTLSSLTMDATSHINENQFGVGSVQTQFTVPCKIKKLHPDAIVPSYSKDGDGCVDLHCVSFQMNENKNQITYKTGIAIEIPHGYVGLVFPRSSIRRTILSLSNSVGVIDSGYRGEIMATFNLTNSSDSTIYEVGERVCQLMILPYPKINFTEVEELTESSRGEGGFGSTGK